MSNNKMKLRVKAEIPLRIHFFTVRSGNVEVKTPEKMEVALAYKVSGAYQCMEDIYGSDRGKYSVKHQGSITVEEVMDMVDGKSQTRKSIPVKDEARPVIYNIIDDSSKKIQDANTKNYLFNLMYAKDEFAEILTDSDKTALSRIVKKIDKHLHNKL